ncbi:MAG TPA: hypothetical protein HA354_01880 [Candidatus Poseidoniaceae archaeon]|nr:hypothetical protein [Euryarchaeota archaeon]DAC59530.1 MAG TPA: hypothetical protein D7I07_01855 [Candidatus Poseidoniales archaeon]HII37229.1 hypothetical protein [Candidatus Poseidoniaceae archaeon]|tara:strand:+ start:4184 stop:4501 length:318 start_codon:yes stop_codon:yes gene_type:complete
MKIVRFSDYRKSSDLSVLDGARWLIIHHEELESAAAVLFHSELLDILVGVDHRGSKISDGLWQRAVHLILADAQLEQDDERSITRRTGITKVVLDSTEKIEFYCY